MDYRQIFLNKLGNDIGLYAEDNGKIITVYDTSFKDYYFFMNVLIMNILNLGIIQS